MDVGAVLYIVMLGLGKQSGAQSVSHFFYVDANVGWSKV